MHEYFLGSMSIHVRFILCIDFRAADIANIPVNKDAQAELQESDNEQNQNSILFFLIFYNYLTIYNSCSQ